MVVTSRVHPATCVAPSVIYCRCNCDRQNWLPIESVCTPALLVATPNILLRGAIPLRSILDAGFCLLGLPFGLSIEHSLARSLLLDWKTMAPTTQLALSHMGLDICDMIDAFRNPVVFRAPIDIHGRAALYKAQHRWATLFKKRERSPCASTSNFHRIQVSLVILLRASCVHVDIEFLFRPVCGHLNDSNQWVHHAQADVLFHWFRIHYFT